MIESVCNKNKYIRLLEQLEIGSLIVTAFLFESLNC
jgi:hypothetical protein